MRQGLVLSNKLCDLNWIQILLLCLPKMLKGYNVVCHYTVIILKTWTLIIKDCPLEDR